MEAENGKEDAQDVQIAFFESLRRKQTTFVSLQKGLSEIVKSEAEAKNQSKSLLTADPSNVAVLQSYRDLLGVVLCDSEMGDCVSLKVDCLEEDSVENTRQR